MTKCAYASVLECVHLDCFLYILLLLFHHAGFLAAADRGEPSAPVDRSVQPGLASQVSCLIAAF